ncbi:putative quinol monooxygenase [Hoyosella altamirensis]|uniref:Quinol monooxygenase YgiN n=1 Tax=Hoyosella altamirensis TaxID=616997 RepID=A0A839RI58_9ACTN|nr:antibiotic biosynthesis monooxygenase [Hoyosella altamirensis]MBB3036057.1 quinol monooxygenase YgiN [Hoyosella altamirensis]
MSAVKLTGRLVCVDDAEAETVLRHLPRHMELTRAEAGCLHFDVEPTGDPRVWSVSERFVDQAAFDAHQARVRTSEWGQATSGIAREYVIETHRDGGQ